MDISKELNENTIETITNLLNSSVIPEITHEKGFYGDITYRFRWLVVKQVNKFWFLKREKIIKMITLNVSDDRERGICGMWVDYYIYNKHNHITLTPDDNLLSIVRKKISSYMEKVNAQDIILLLEKEQLHANNLKTLERIFLNTMD